MAIERQTAKKVRAIHITSGQWVKKEGLEPSYILSRAGEKIARARVMGTVVNKFVAEDGSFASITIDDGTDTVRCKTFKTVKPLDTVEVGELVDAIGKVREYNEEVYMIPEVVAKVTDPNWELLRRAEIALKAKALKAAGPEQDPQGEAEELREKALEIIGSSKDGVTYEELTKALKAKDAEVDHVVNVLLEEGVCYEPTPGKIKKI